MKADMRSVVILQEYIPAYRVPFFEALVSKAALSGISVRIGHGEPNSTQARRNDASETGTSFAVRQREFSLAKRRVVVRRLPRAVRSADLLVIEQARRNIDVYRLLLPRWLRRPRRIAMWGHGRDYTKSATRFETLLQTTLTKRADWFFAYTSAGVEHVVARGFSRESVTLVQNSTDSYRLARQIDMLTLEEKRRFALKHDLCGRTALFIGALDDSKSIPLLLASSRLARQSDPHFRLIIGGEGPLQHAVEAEAKSSDHIVYLGTLEGGTRALAFGCSELLAIPGRVGLVAVDSIASGLPIVTTDWTLHAPEYEYLDETTRVEVEQNPKLYSTAMLDLLDDDAKRHQMTHLLRARQQHFGVDAMAENYLRGLVEALEVAT